MNTITKKSELDLQNLPSILPADKLCALFSINPQTFRVMLWRARKVGVPMPPRKRILRRYFYPVDDFARWLWQYGERLHGEYSKSTDADASEIE